MQITLLTVISKSQNKINRLSDNDECHNAALVQILLVVGTVVLAQQLPRSLELFTKYYLTARNMREMYRLCHDLTLTENLR